MIRERDRIQAVMTAVEIAAALESGDYSAEMLMQHLIRHHNRLEQERNDARKELDQIKTILSDPLAVHLNMMRGTIKWTPANLRALLGDTGDARAIIDATLKVLPVGYIPAHTPESLPGRVADLVSELAVWRHEAKRLEAELAKFDETAIEWWCEYQDLKAKAREP